MMVPEMEKPRVTEIRVRMDCNGCVQKIKKALHGITGMSDLYIDFPQQKVTIVGWADPEKIVKAIKKTRKTAVICSHTEQSEQPAQPTTEPEPEGATPVGGAPPPESTDPPTEQPQTEAAPPEEGKKEETPPSPPPDKPPHEANPSSESSKETTSQSTQPSKPRGHDEIHVIQHHPPDYGFRYAYGHYLQPGNGRQGNTYPSGPGFREEPPQPPQPQPQPIHVTHSYNTYRPSPYITEYAYPPWNVYPGSPGIREEPPQPPQPIHVNHSYTTYKPSPYMTEYAYPPWKTYPSGSGIRQQPPQPPQPIHVTQNYNPYKPSPYVTEYAYPPSPPGYSHYSRPDHYSQVYYSGNNGSGNGNITSMFSEENPNACSIV